MVDIDLNSLSAAQKQRFQEANQDPILFGEYLLKHPSEDDPGTLIPFEANFIQRIIMGSRARDVYICVHRRSGKCVSGDTLVLDPKTQRPIPIEEASHIEETVLFDFKLNRTVWAPATWVNSGTKHCLKLSLSSGVKQTLSDDHLVFDWKRGWVRSDELRIGDRILAPSRIEGLKGKPATATQINRAVDKTLAETRIPDEPFGYDNDSLELFLRELWKDKGRLLEHQRSASMMLWSRSLGLDIQHLLRRLGAETRVDEDGNLFIDDPIDLALFLATVAGLDIPVLEAHSPRRWEIVTHIRKVGERPVYDLCVEHRDHNFIGNGLVLHNSFSLTVLALWHALTNKSQHIVMFAPSSDQVDAFFTVLNMWIDNNPWLSSMVVSNRRDPQRITLSNGSFISGRVLGVSSNTQEGKRGIEAAHVVIVDESHLLSMADWKIVFPILKGDIYKRHKIRGYLAGTLNEPVGEFYERVDRLGDVVNKNGRELIKVIKLNVEQNEDWTDEMRAEEKATTPEDVWKTEYMLEVGISNDAVFRKDDIEAAFTEDWELGAHLVDWKDSDKVRFLTVDWDKFQAGSNILVTEYNTRTGDLTMLYYEEVARSRFHYTEAVQKVIEVFRAFDPIMLICDKGAGEKQFEDLELIAMQHPEWGLQGRIVQCAYQTKIEIEGISTGETEKRMIKPYLVSLLNAKFQQLKIHIPSHQYKVRDQFIDYKIKGTTINTTKFSSHNEHAIDCFLFATWGVYSLFENPLDKGDLKDKILILKPKDLQRNTPEESRDILWANLDGERSGFGDSAIRSSLYGSSRGDFGRGMKRSGLFD